MGCKKLTYTDFESPLKVVYSDSLTTKKLHVATFGNTKKVDVNYYPFGQVMPNRHGNDETYKFGFNDMLKDDELKGNSNSYDFGARIYDPRLGRWLSCDPLARKYPSETPFNFVKNSPLIMIDPSGKSGIVIIDKTKGSEQITVHAHIVFYGEGNSDMAKSEATRMQSMWNSANGTVKIDDIEYKVKFVITAEYNKELTKSDVEKNTDHSVNYFRLDKLQQTPPAGIDTKDGETGNSGVWNPDYINGSTTTGSHELGHILGIEEHTEMMVKAGQNSFITEGNPGIMVVRGKAVCAPYTWDGVNDSHYNENNEMVNTVNINKRTVTQQDIDNLGLKDLKFDKNGKALLGKLSNIFHEAIPKKK